MAKAKHAVPDGHHTVTPQLTLDNAAQAIRVVQEGSGAEEVARATAPTGKSCTRRCASAIRFSC